MAKPFSLTHHFSSLCILSRSRLIIPSAAFLPHHHQHRPTMSPFSLSLFPKFLSTNPTPYPLQYEMIISHPVQTRPPRARRNNPQTFPEPDEPDEPDEPEELTSELRLDSWVDRKLSFDSESGRPGSPKQELDKAKRKYYNKRRKRMYGSDSEEDETRRPEEKFVELKPEVVELPTLHRREEELYFYDTFAYPWEKEKHYKMVYQLEKKYFPDQCLDQAFLQPGQSNANLNENENTNAKSKGKDKKRVGVGGVVRRERKDDIDKGDSKLVFFEEKREEEKKGDGNLVKGLREKKVEEFFKGLKRVEKNRDGEVGGVNVEPYLSSRRTGLPSVWDSPHGTVVLINKPKGEFL